MVTASGLIAWFLAGIYIAHICSGLYSGKKIRCMHGLHKWTGRITRKRPGMFFDENNKIHSSQVYYRHCAHCSAFREHALYIDGKRIREEG